MRQNHRHLWRWSMLAAAVAVAFSVTSANADPRVVRIATQYGISYLPLTIMAEKKLLEAEGKKLGLDLSTEWVRFTGGPPMNEALISGNLDFASGGVSPMVTIWARTQGNLKVKGICAHQLDAALPQHHQSQREDHQGLHREGPHRAAGGARVDAGGHSANGGRKSVRQGPGTQARCQWTVSLSHPDGLAQMMSGKSEITGHFTSAPFMYTELADKRVHRVLNSYDVFGGPHTFNVVWASAKLYEGEPKVVQAFLAALRIAMKDINDDPAGSAALWVKADKSKLTPAQAEKIIRDPENKWTMTPEKVMVVADYMSRVKMIPVAPKSWKDMFIDAVHDLPGS